MSKLTAENEERCRMLEEHAEGVNRLEDQAENSTNCLKAVVMEDAHCWNWLRSRLLDWIEGPGEKWLLTLHEIGENKDEARQLVKEHQQLALKSKVGRHYPRLLAIGRHYPRLSAIEC